MTATSIQDCPNGQRPCMKATCPPLESTSQRPVNHCCCQDKLHHQLLLGLLPHQPLTMLTGLTWM